MLSHVKGAFYMQSRRSSKQCHFSTIYSRITDTLDPDWCHTFPLQYEFGSPTKFVVNLFDDQQKGSDANGKNMGAAYFDIDAILASRGSTMSKKTKGGGRLYASLRQSNAEDNGKLVLQLKADSLKNTEGLGIFNKSDPFFEICRRRTEDGNNWDTVYRSEHIKNDLSPTWKETTIDMNALCGGDLTETIQIRIYDHDRNGKHDKMGFVDTTTAELFDAARNQSPLDVSAGGMITVSTAKLHDGPSFLDYIAGGCQMNVVLGIDFSASNGDPRQPGTLHHFYEDGTTLNDYEKAIRSIIGVLSKYDKNKKYPAYGFGAKYDGEVRHSFQIGNEDELDGLNGLMTAYRNIFNTGLVMSGPTVITEVIDAAAAKADISLQEALVNNSQSYTVLVVLTDGCVTDMTSTIRCLLDNNDKPLSIVIVGLGEERNFSQMTVLDNLRRHGKRDIVEFVCFGEHNESSAALASATLSEIPNQLESFFHSRGMMPCLTVEPEEGEIAVHPIEEKEPEIDISLDFVDDEIVVSGGGIHIPEW